MSNYIESSSMTNDLGSSAHRYALASHDPDGVVRWSVGGEWNASLLDQSPTLMTGPEVDAFKVRHPNARIVDVIVYREACEVYSAGCNSVLDHSERSTPQTRQAAREAGIKALIRAGFPEDALNIVGPENHEQAPAARKLSNYIEQAPVMHESSARGWPKAGISDETAGRAFQRAKSPLSVAESTPSFIVTSGEDIVAQVFERPDQGLSDKDRMAEMWSRARLLALAPKMHAVLTLIANQSLSNERSAEQTIEFIRSQAMQVLDQSRGLSVGERVAVEPFDKGKLPRKVQDNLRQATILLDRIQQLQLLQVQVDAFLSDPAKQLIERIATASADLVPELEEEVSSFPNDGFYKSEIRTALIKRVTELRSTTAEHVELHSSHQ